MKQECIRGIFAIESPSLSGNEIVCRLLYSPFNGKMALATEEEWRSIREELISGNITDDGIKELINDRPISENVDISISSVKNVVKLSVLPTNKCNFSCAYCYSREGRDSTQVPVEVLDRTLEYFINSERVKSRELTISYLGGGEPMLCWELFKHSLEYSDELAKRHGFTLMNSVNTNGSILDDEKIEYLKRYDVTVCVTFEVFEDVQNRQRGQWNKVRENIKKMLEAGIRVILSSIITPLSVVRMEELVDTVMSEYPGVRTLIIEPVVDMTSSNFDSAEDLRVFYEIYTSAFFKALPKAEENGVRLLNSVIRKLWRIHTRFCDGEISLTALGTISGCTSVSSPRERHYADYCYGDARLNPIMIDEEKFTALLHRNIFSYNKCADCFLKWHCCGGCQFRNDLYSEEELSVVCDFNRAFALRYLMDILKHNLIAEGENIDEY